MTVITAPRPTPTSVLGATRGWRVPVMIGAVATIITAAGSWIPSMWGDEAASVMSAERSWSSLVRMLGNVDAVHGVYYAFLHLWIDVFGASAFSVRFPSALAIGAVAAGLYVLCARLGEPRVGLLAAAACVILPRIGYMGTEARSTAFSAALAVWLTVLLMELIRRRFDSRPLIVLYAVGVTLAIHVFLYTVLILVVHGVVVVAARIDRHSARRWMIAGTSAVVVSLPFIAIALSQRGQIEFLARRHVTGPDDILVTQWFGGMPFALIAWALIVISAIGWVVSLRARRSTRRDTSRRLLAVIGISWLVIPTVLLLAANAVAGPLYTNRYLSFSAPAAGLLIALGLVALRSSRVRMVAVAVVIIAALPFQIAQRTPTAKHGNDWSEVSEVIGEMSHPGDGIVFDDSVRPSRKPRLALHLYPDGFTGLVDLELSRPFDQTDYLWDEVTDLGAVSSDLATMSRVWVVARSEHGTDADEAVLRRSGFSLRTTYDTPQNTILLYTKGTR